MLRRSPLSALVGSACLALAAGVAACEAPPPPSRGDAPEPAEALRPDEDRGSVPEEARIADYVIDARLDAETHTITGSLRLTWRNRTRTPVRTLPFHLYMNGFRSEDTAWMREARGSHRGERQEKDTKEGAWGTIDLSRIVALGPPQPGGVQGGELRPGEPVPLSWAEDADPSTMTATLPFEVGPEEAITVEIDFTTKLPKVFARTGYYKDFHMVGQWYPKIGVLDPIRGWQNHTFTYHSEFYADFGDYEVVLDVPAEMIVGATGILVGERELPRGDDDEGGARKTLRYRAEMVHDFAWAAAPDFVEVRSEWRGIRIRQLLAPEYAGDADAHEAALVATLESMDHRFGPYPWSTITVIHPPDGAGGAAGMEYPTLFTSSPMLARSIWLRAFGLEERVSGLFTTIHEFGHQYFQGLLASDESREPWLDEGMNTFANALALADWGRAGGGWANGEGVLRLGAQEVVESDLIRLALLFYTDLDPVRSP
ncbi:MAG: M1 family metallopeptidase, partial [Nannocystaceae bacterium]